MNHVAILIHIHRPTGAAVGAWRIHPDGTREQHYDEPRHRLRAELTINAKGDRVD